MKLEDVDGIEDAPLDKADTAQCVVCGQRVPLANLELYHHVMAHKAAIYWTPVKETT